MAELIKTFKKTVSLAVQHGEVVCSTNHIGIGLNNLGAQFTHVIFNLADVVLDTSKAGNAWRDLLAGKRDKLCFYPNRAQNLLYQLISAAVLPWTSRHA